MKNESNAEFKLGKAPLSADQYLDIFRKSSALLEGHFLLTSGKHSAQYMQCAQVLQYPERAAILAEGLASVFRDLEIQTVIGPATGGILVSHEVAKALGVRSLFTERENGIMRLRRGFTLSPGERVLVVEDVITTGGSVREVLSVVREFEAIPVGVGVLVDRTGGTVDFGLPQSSIIQLEIQAYEAQECPLCAQGIPAIKPGSRKL
ncbi:orotate phosphoribosyltransferase [Desulfosporosinus sp. BICA1-9]|uniref:orotate phosphoribosyltransferase n=1 Tax=Desulfosporosinus sp. BICA1-9 TaxID=1531958 RepID=UPI00054BA8AD|nr:orotate phosphoribosyltransferase [Desulfosporosinus sp. BICA1-9]KJS48908.1 MAG: Orotate phosphoribosyltransferase [Peptococcaceae bacterium BRH_c23]KJS79434.1 MAG: Orotate phosphoribosyltransferase [Desulfosporosinus sp. BICA1-9]KJS89459.1 MAG: Orotate phosphoribosyltransferase [Desulfosporosinus sp. BICA1-9]